MLWDSPREEVEAWLINLGNVMSAIIAIVPIKKRKIFRDLK